MGAGINEKVLGLKLMTAAAVQADWQGRFLRYVMKESDFQWRANLMSCCEMPAACREMQAPT